ncbi:hypothetical protein RHGRI_032603 [Rhododendron griersonianum]|uniref:Uncharacterized protein n=1 Tax=Rhododendron griersonianum TaxID=479676 RepID=A0AAV6IG90_9ERIC|nr:hypothetical protein RHGRI_032603 [Rhododendron griersonianum]
MAWRGSLSRSVMATARSSTIRSSPPLPRLRPPPLAAPRLQSRRLSFANPREEWKRWVMRGAFTVIKRRSNDAAL